VATRFHHAILDAQSRAIAAQVGILIVLNLVIGFSGLLNVDNYAHVGGLLAGLWLGFILPPGQVATLASMWHTPGGGRPSVQTALLRVGGVAALVAVILIGVAMGTSRWQQFYQQPLGHVAGQTTSVLAAPRLTIK
jgi:membrane associated rhomboid family serine protease